MTCLCIQLMAKSIMHNTKITHYMYINVHKTQMPPQMYTGHRILPFCPSGGKYSTNECESKHPGARVYMPPVIYRNVYV